MNTELREIQPLSYRLIRFIIILAVYLIGYIVLDLLRINTDFYEMTCAYSGLFLLYNNFFGIKDILLRIGVFLIMVAVICTIQQFLSKANIFVDLGFLCMYYAYKTIDDRIEK